MQVLPRSECRTAPEDHACNHVAETEWWFAGLWEGGKKKWVKRLLAHRDGELDCNLAEAMDLCQEAARQARSAGEVVMPQPSLRN